MYSSKDKHAVMKCYRSFLPSIADNWLNWVKRCAGRQWHESVPELIQTRHPLIWRPTCYCSANVTLIYWMTGRCLRLYLHPDQSAKILCHHTTANSKWIPHQRSWEITLKAHIKISRSQQGKKQPQCYISMPQPGHFWKHVQVTLKPLPGHIKPFRSKLRGRHC